tara:strand:+ start:535 stop:867 length:333 start_codon:yes stop_codon:yes gene_type:complete
MPPKKAMPRLTVAQQRMLYHSLPAATKLRVKKKCLECQMKGDGIMSILKSVGRSLGKIGKAIGPTVLKEIIAPIVVSKFKGKGLTLPGGKMTTRRGRPRRVSTMPKRYKK